MARLKETTDNVAPYCVPRRRLKKTSASSVKLRTGFDAKRKPGCQSAYGCLRAYRQVFDNGWSSDTVTYLHGIVIPLSFLIA